MAVPQSPQSRRPGLFKIVGCAVFFSFVVVLLVAADLQPGDRATKAKGCAQTERRLAVGLLLYGGDYDDNLPVHDWARVSFDPPKDSSWPRTYEDLKCPALAAKNGSGFALLAGLAKVDEKDFTSKQVMLFETDTIGWNVVAPLTALSSRSRHNHLFSFAFTDCHVKSFGDEAVAQGRFKS